MTVAGPTPKCPIQAHRKTATKGERGDGPVTPRPARFPYLVSYLTMPSTFVSGAASGRQGGPVLVGVRTRHRVAAIALVLAGDRDGRVGVAAPHARGGQPHLQRAIA